MRCHYVPRLYLKYFENVDEMLWVYDKKNISVKKQHRNNTAVKNDLYIIEGDKGLEEYYANSIESPVKPVLDKIVNNPKLFSKLSGDDFRKLAQFFGFLHVRVLRSIDASKEIAMIGADVIVERMKSIADNPKEMKLSFNKYCEETGNPNNMTFDKCREIYKDPLKGIKIKHNEDRAVAMSIHIVDNIISAMLKMNWSLYITKENHDFITNDSPVNVFTPTGEKEAILGGLGLEKVQVSFPLSPRLCLFMCRERMRKIQNVDSFWVKEINKRVVAMANRYIISSFKSNKIIELIKESPNKYGDNKLDSGIVKDELRKGIKNII